MLKNILNLEGAVELSRNEQKSITGGRRRCESGCGLGICCPDGYCKDAINAPFCNVLD